MFDKLGAVGAIFGGFGTLLLSAVCNDWWRARPWVHSDSA